MYFMCNVWFKGVVGLGPLQRWTVCKCLKVAGDVWRVRLRAAARNGCLVVEALLYALISISPQSTSGMLLVT